MSILTYHRAVSFTVVYHVTLQSQLSDQPSLDIPPLKTLTLSEGASICLERAPSSLDQLRSDDGVSTHSLSSFLPFYV